jgi:fibronectin type 3 domain-containing protein
MKKILLLFLLLCFRPSVAATTTASFQLVVVHNVQLSWTQSNSPNLIGYNVYRGLQSGKETLYYKIGVGAGWTDTYVDSYTTYFYYLTAVDSSSQESVPSNETSATVPGP